jgi:7-keto-8-aminopelargonate synthetase-like enzyme
MMNEESAAAKISAAVGAVGETGRGTTELTGENRIDLLAGTLRENGILATGTSYPVVPRGDEEIRFQVGADHTRYDLDHVLKVPGECKETALTLEQKRR